MNKFFLVITLSLLVVVGLVQSFNFHDHEMETDDKIWELYIRWRSYHTVTRSIEVKQTRYDIFMANAQYVNTFNKLDKPYKLKLNKFADMTNDEFKSIYTAGSNVKNDRVGLFQGRGRFMYNDVEKVPTSIDWREKGDVNPVKRQCNTPLS